jgi:hypothetical protein
MHFHAFVDDVWNLVNRFAGFENWFLGLVKDFLGFRNGSNASFSKLWILCNVTGDVWVQGRVHRARVYFEPLLDHIWAMFGPCLCAIVGPQLGHVWAMFGPCLSYIGVMLGPCVDHVWAMFRPCLGYV